ncbi:MAG: tautomerase family protein [Spirochaetales bacterium]|nr:tautomerase family protein [Spirochaetales bacterium]
MPIISYECVRATAEQKQALIEELTKTAAHITAIPQSSFTVLIKENPVENWGIGGRPLDQVLKDRENQKRV